MAAAARNLRALHWLLESHSSDARCQSAAMHHTDRLLRLQTFLQECRAKDASAGQLANKLPGNHALVSLQQGNRDRPLPLPWANCPHQKLTHSRGRKRNWMQDRNFGGDRNVPYLDFDDGYMTTYICQKSLNCCHIKLLNFAVFKL